MIDMETLTLRVTGWTLLILLLIIPAGAATAGSSQGWYNIHCNADGASIYFDGEYKGQIADGILLISVQTSGTPYARITAKKSGYESVEAVLPPLQAGRTVDLTITLTELPPPSTLTVTSSPAGASVLIDSTVRGETPITLTDLKADKMHIVTVRLEGYEDWKTTITIPAEGSKTLNAGLKILADQSVYIDSIPQGVNLYVDERYYGITPKTVTELTPGPHNVRLSLGGYEDKAVTINVIKGQTEPVTLTLRALPGSAGTGSIKVVSAPGGAEIYLDGIYQNRLTPATLTDISPGSHSIVVRLEGYDDAGAEVVVADGRTTSASLALTTSAATPTKVPGMLWTSALAGMLMLLGARRIYR